MTDEPMRPKEVLEGMEELDIRVVAHITVEGRHEYNVSKKQIQDIMGCTIVVLKWERNSLSGPKARKQNKKGALYQLAK